MAVGGGPPQGVPYDVFRDLMVVFATWGAGLAWSKTSPHIRNDFVTRDTGSVFGIGPFHRSHLRFLRRGWVPACRQRRCPSGATGWSRPESANEHSSRQESV